MTTLNQLQNDAQTMGVALNENCAQRLLDYAALLEKWNKVYNLTAIRDQAQAYALHLLDSLSVLPYLRDIGTLADVGTGGGLPGIPLAIACGDDLRVTLIETNHKKASFLQQAKIELGLNNVNVLNQRVEQVELQAQFDGVISRAFSDLADFVSLAGPLAKQDGTLFAMKGLYPHEEINQLPAQWQLAMSRELTVPHVEAHRHLLELKRA